MQRIRYIAILSILPLFSLAQQLDTIKIGVIINNNGLNQEIISPTLNGIQIAFQNSPLNLRKYFFPEGRYWRCENNCLKGYDDDKLMWQQPIKLCMSAKQSAIEQFNELVNKDSVLTIIGLPNSTIVKEFFQSTNNNIPLISSVATASEFTIKSRNKFTSTEEENKWVNSKKWFFRVTSPDIIRIESLIDWIREEGIRTCYVLHGSNTYSLGLLQDFKFILSQQDGLTVDYASYSAQKNPALDEDSLKSIIDNLSKFRGKIESIVLLGYSADETILIKKIKKYTNEIPIFTVEPSIDKESKLYWGREFNNIRALSAQILWNGDYDIKQFTEKYSEHVKKNQFVEEQTIPLSAGFAYDAALLSFAAIHECMKDSSNLPWQKLNITKKRERLRKTLTTLGNLPLIMSKGQITYSHDVIAKLQRTFIKDNQFYLYAEVPTNFSTFWINLLLGGMIGGLSRVIVYIHGQLKERKRDTKLYPGHTYILWSIITGLFGALIISIFWPTTLLHEILPKFFDEFSLYDDPFIIGILGGLVPTALIAFLTKNSTAKE